MNQINLHTTAPTNDHNAPQTKPISIPIPNPNPNPNPPSSLFHQPTATAFPAPDVPSTPCAASAPTPPVAAAHMFAPLSNPRPRPCALTATATATATASPSPATSAPTSAPPNRTPFKPSPPPPSSAAFKPRPTLQLSMPSSHSLPDVIPTISPSYPATLFGGLSPDDEHVTVWHPASGKTVAGNAAPYRRNLVAWLHAHPRWEEKADELKSSKRRSAARRSRIAAHAFAAVCCYPVATVMAADIAHHLAALAGTDHCNEAAMAHWTVDDFVRLQECLCRLAHDLHKFQCHTARFDPHRWSRITQQLGPAKVQGTVIYCAHHMLTRGIAKSLRELADADPMPEENVGSLVEYALPPSSLIGSPASLADRHPHHQNLHHPPAPGSTVALLDVHHLSASLPSPPPAAVLERSFRAPREPRVTVWNPQNGRTISGNAAPCRRNLQAWMKHHPGWLPKEEGQLSSSRRNRNRKARPSTNPPTTAAAAAAATTAANPTLPIACAASPNHTGDGAVPGTPNATAVDMAAEPESPHFHDALEGLLVLARSPHAGSETLKAMRRGAILDADAPTDADVQMDSGMTHNDSPHPISSTPDPAADNEMVDDEQQAVQGHHDDGDEDDEGEGEERVVQNNDEGNATMEDGASFVPTSSVSCSSLDDHSSMCDDDDNTNNVHHSADDNAKDKDEGNSSAMEL